MERPKNAIAKRFQDERWLGLQERMLADAGHRCSECGASASRVHVGVWPKSGKPWEAKPKYLKPLCVQCWSDRLLAEKETKRILARFTLSDLDRILDGLEEVGKMPQAKRSVALEQVYREVKKWQSDAGPFARRY